jgi:malonyl CoA-acyl carrier protein transacylase
MTTIKLTRDMVAERASGREAIDSIFLSRIGALLAPANAIRALKMAEASRILTGHSSALIKAEADQRGISETELAQIVVARGQAALVAVAEIEARRQSAQAEVDAALTPAAIQAIIQSHR